MFLSKKVLGIRFNRQEKKLVFHYVACDMKGTEYLDKFEIHNGHCNIKEFNAFARTCLPDVNHTDFTAEELFDFCRAIYDFTCKKVSQKFKATDENVISYTTDDSTAALLLCEGAVA